MSRTDSTCTCKTDADPLGGEAAHEAARLVFDLMQGKAPREWDKHSRRLLYCAIAPDLLRTMRDQAEADGNEFDANEIAYFLSCVEPDDFGDLIEDDRGRAVALGGGRPSRLPEVDVRVKASVTYSGDSRDRFVPARCGETRDCEHIATYIVSGTAGHGTANVCCCAWHLDAAVVDMTQTCTGWAESHRAARRAEHTPQPPKTDRGAVDEWAAF